MNEDITIQIVIYEEKLGLLKKCLDKIKNFKIIIIDNSNNIKLKKKIESEYIIKKYILNKKNLGYSKGHNQAIDYVDTEFTLILNADCLIETKDILKLLEAHKTYKNCIISVPTSYDDEGKLTYTSGLLPENGNMKNIPIKLNGNISVENALGSAMCIKKETFIKLGKFNENLFLFYSDDDLCRNIKKINKEIIQIFDSKVIHSHGISKVKNVFKRIFIREFYLTLDELNYYLISSDTKLKEILGVLKKKKYLLKFFMNITFFKINKSISYLAKYLAFKKFEKINKRTVS